VSFVHEDPDFEGLVRIVADKRGLSLSLVEKDYWVTHTLWALVESGLEVWLKGGTSLSKGFSLIERFSEDLDLKIEPGRVVGVPGVTSWKSEGSSATRSREAFFAALVSRLAVPGAEVVMDVESADRSWRTANLHVVYRRRQMDALAGLLRPFVLLEVGSARVDPFVARDMSSFVHEELSELGQLGDFDENRPRSVRCVHPFVTLIEKLDALRRRARNETVDPPAFVRHFEDAANIILGAEAVPPLPEGHDVRRLAAQMEAERQTAGPLTSKDPAFEIQPGPRGDAIRAAFDALAPMFWGPRVALDDACRSIREWIRGTIE